MRHVKLLTALVLIVAMLFPYSVVNAYHSPSPADQDDTVESNGYIFHIQTEETSNHQVIRSYTLTDEDHPTARSVPTDTADRTKALLLAMGWDQEMVDSLSPDDLQDYASCEQITTTVSYVKENAQGDITYISEQEAISGSTALSERPEEVSDVTYTSYMRLTHTVTHYGEAYYRFATDAYWMTMPLNRLKDAIGSCAPTLAIDSSSRYGYYTCNREYYDFLLGDSFEDTITGTLTPVTGTPNGDWYGSAATFSLPRDVVADPSYGEYITALYSDLRVHYEYKAYLRYSDQETNFNSVGTYSHAKIAPAFSPSISIDLGGGVSASIGLSAGISQDRVSVELLLHYVP